MAPEIADDRNAHSVGSLAMTAIAARAGGNDVVTIVVARDFSRYPGGRYRIHGENSGEAFRDDFLVPALATAKEQHGRVVVDIDGAAGYASSFLEEAFGGLVRERNFTASELAALLRIRAGELFDSYRLLAERYIREAQPRARA